MGNTSIASVTINDCPRVYAEIVLTLASTSWQLRPLQRCLALTTFVGLQRQVLSSQSAMMFDSVKRVTSYSRVRLLPVEIFV